MLLKNQALYILLCILIFFAGIAVGYTMNQHDSEPLPESASSVYGVSEPIVAKETPQAVTREPQGTFYLIIENDSLKIYQCTGAKKEFLSTVDYIDLPSVDETQREIIKNGISFPSKQALAEFIENLDS